MMDFGLSKQITVRWHKTVKSIVYLYIIARWFNKFAVWKRNNGFLVEKNNLKKNISVDTLPQLQYTYFNDRYLWIP